MLKLSLKQGQYVNIGENIRVVYVGGSGNHARLLIDAPRELNIARSTTEENPARKKETYYAEPGISREAQQEIKRILWNERMKAEAKKDAESLKDKFNVRCTAEYTRLQSITDACDAPQTWCNKKQPQEKDFRRKRHNTPQSGSSRRILL